MLPAFQANLSILYIFSLIEKLKKKRRALSQQLAPDCLPAVIEHALKKNIKPDMARQVGMLCSVPFCHWRQPMVALHLTAILLHCIPLMTLCRALQRMSAEPRWSPEPGEHVPDSTGNAEQLAEAADAGVYDVSTRPAGASSMQQLEQEGGSELSGQQPDRGSSQAGVGLAAFAAGGSAAVLDISDADDERLSITRLMGKRRGRDREGEGGRRIMVADHILMWLYGRTLPSLCQVSHAAAAGGMLCWRDVPEAAATQTGACLWSQFAFSPKHGWQHTQLERT